MAQYPSRAYLKYEEAKEDALQRVQLIRAAAASGPLPRPRLIRFMGNLTRVLDILDTCAATPGIVEYARSQFTDPTRDVVGEFTALRAQLESTRNWISANFPKQGASWLDNGGYDNYGNPVQLNFSQAQLVPFVAECDSLLAVIVA